MSHPGTYATTRPESTALIRASDGAVLSWSGLHGQAIAAANRLTDLGLGPGSAVAICMENRFEFVAFVWASHYAGFRYTPISTQLGSEEVAYILADCEAEAVVVSDRTIDIVRSALSARAQVASMPPTLNVDQIALSAPEPERPRYTRAEGIGMLYSSGTTGQPKGVYKAAPEKPIEEIPPEDAMVGKLYGINVDTIYLSTAPLYHSAPLAFLLWMGRLGGAMVIMERFDAAEALALIERHGVTHSQWLPTMFVRMLRLSEAKRTGYNLSSHRFAIHGAAPCPIGVKEAMLEWWGPIVYEYYAGTEGAGTCVIGPSDWLAHKGSVGKPLGGVIHILGEGGEALSQGEVGEIWFEGRASFEYYKDAEKTGAARRGGLATFGDVGYLDEDGFLYLTDRKAFTMNIGGVNVYPQEAENVLVMHPAVLDAAVFGVPNSEYGEEVKGVVELVPGAEAGGGLAEELMGYCREHLARVKCPRSIEFEAALPRHPNGKLYKQKLRDQYRKR